MKLSRLALAVWTLLLFVVAPAFADGGFPSRPTLQGLKLFDGGSPSGEQLWQMQPNHDTNSNAWLSLSGVDGSGNVVDWLTVQRGSTQAPAQAYQINFATNNGGNSELLSLGGADLKFQSDFLYDTEIYVNNLNAAGTAYTHFAQNVAGSATAGWELFPNNAGSSYAASCYVSLPCSVLHGPELSLMTGDSHTGLRLASGSALLKANGSTVFSSTGSALSITPNTSIAGTLGVTGAATLASAGVTGNATVGGTLGVTGAATLASAGVTGNATVGGTLHVTGASALGSLGATSGSFSNTLTAGNGITISAGSSDLGGPIIVEQTTYFGNTSGGIVIQNAGNPPSGGTSGDMGNGTLNATGVYVNGSSALVQSMTAAAALAGGLTITGSGLQVGSPTGGNEGAGTINATAIYQNGVPLAPLFSMKASDTARTNGTGMSSDPDLQLSLAASATYEFDAVAWVTCTTSTDTYFASLNYSGSVAISSDAWFNEGNDLGNSASAFSVALRPNTTQGIGACQGSASHEAVHIHGFIKTSTAGALAWQWGGGSTNTVTYKAGSAIRATRIL